MKYNRKFIERCALLLCCIVTSGSSLAQSTSHNFIMAQTMLDTLGTNAFKSVQYYDGLGYPTLQSTTGPNDSTLNTLVTYDGARREYRKYAAIPGEKTLSYITEADFVKKSKNSYNDDYGYTQNHYDALDRVTAVDIAGNAWHSANKQNKTTYSYNTSSDNVMHYVAPLGTSYSLLIASPCYYTEKTLSKENSYDADNKSITVFKDFQGHKILERTSVGDTYYVYNDLGQLRFVLTPKYQTDSHKNQRGYEYRYDYRGRLVKKILPNCGPTQYWYDNADRMSYMKDPLLGDRYRFYLYDKFGRLCVQGTCGENSNREASIVSTTTYMGGSYGICQTGYTIPYTIEDPKLEIVNYYDNYNFVNGGKSASLPSVSISSASKNYAVGFQTGLIVYASNGEALGTINIYDQKGEIVKTVRKNINGYVEDQALTYSHTGKLTKSYISVNVKYGPSLSIITNNSYTNTDDRISSKELQIYHANQPGKAKFKYSYNNKGMMNSVLHSVGSSYVPMSYSYDIHGWITNISYPTGFTEKISYADGGCYNGNISQIEWKNCGESTFKGYRFTYDAINRLTDGIYGTDSWTHHNDDYNEHVEYDCNGNITRLQRRGLKMDGKHGKIDNLHMQYTYDRLVSVTDDADQITYNGAVDFNGTPYQGYSLTYYDKTGSLKSDAGRKIACIQYDNFNNPIRIQFTNGNVTKYIYSATGEKLRAIYQTAVSNIKVAIGATKELSSAQILCTDSVDYLLNGILTLKNGAIDRYQFGDGYFLAGTKASNNTTPFNTFYYIKDHLGSIREVLTENGSTTQKTNYYPFGMQFCDGNTGTNSTANTLKYNGKEFDTMHGLNTYDYGARQYNPVTARWDRMDPLCEKYYSVSPYTYANNNPISYIDPNGMDWIESTGDSIYWYSGDVGDKSEVLIVFNATSGYKDENVDYQNSDYQEIPNLGPTPEGSYYINLVPDPARHAETYKREDGSLDYKKSPDGGIEQLTYEGLNENGEPTMYSSPAWGDHRAALTPNNVKGASKRDNNSYYFHDSQKGYTHGCTEVPSALFGMLQIYRDAGNSKIDVVVNYPKHHKTNGGTKK